MSLSTKKIYFVTLGCAKNDVLTEYMQGLFSGPKYELTEDPNEAHVVVINTCGFINDAKQQSINYMIEAGELKKSGNCELIIAIGCLVQKYAQELKEALPEIDIFVGATNYQDVKKIIEDYYDRSSYSIYWDKKWKKSNLGVSSQRILDENKPYAYLLIGEGCNHNCSYCAIPEMQGPYRSRKLEDIIEEAKMLASRGFKELILIAQDTSFYGADIYGKPCLEKVLYALSEIKEIEWLRIMYAYPNNITDELVEAMATLPKVCHYIDMPLQHVNNNILKSMYRSITKDEIIEKIYLLRNKIPDIKIRSTFIVGFPGETEEAYQELLAFLQEFKLDRVGVFPYSQEDGTPAASFPNQLSDSLKEKRAKELMDLQYDIMTAKHHQMIGNIYDVVVDEKSSSIENLSLCRSYGETPEIDPYILVYDDLHKIGDRFQVKITGINEFDMVGQVV